MAEIRKEVVGGQIDKAVYRDNKTRKEKKRDKGLKGIWTNQNNLAKWEPRDEEKRKELENWGNW